MRTPRASRRALSGRRVDHVPDGEVGDGHAVGDLVVVDPPLPGELHEDLVRPTVVDVPDRVPLVDVEAVDLHVAEEDQRRGQDALVGGDRLRRADRIAEVDGHLIGLLVDGVNDRPEARVAGSIGAEGVGQRVGAVVDERQVAEHVLVVVGEPLDQREVVAALEIEERAHQPQRLLADLALHQVADQRIAVVALDQMLPTVGLERSSRGAAPSSP